MESKASGRRFSTAERCSLYLDYLSLRFDWLLGGWKLTWGEGCQKGSFHRLPVRGEWPCTVSAQQRQSCLLGVHLLHWLPTLHWGKERTWRLPHLLTLGREERGGWERGREEDKRKRYSTRCRRERGRERWMDKKDGKVGQSTWHILNVLMLTAGPTGHPGLGSVLWTNLGQSFTSTQVSFFSQFKVHWKKISCSWSGSCNFQALGFQVHEKWNIQVNRATLLWAFLSLCNQLFTMRQQTIENKQKTEGNKS